MNIDESNRKILIVDDDLFMNILLQTYLKYTFKGEIISAFSGDQAIAKCLKHHPDMVFMDIKMPNKDGVTTIKELRASGYNNPIVVISSYAEDAKKRCEDAGANAVVPKPVTRQVFVNYFIEFYHPNGKALIG